MSKKLKKRLIRILACIGAFIPVFILTETGIIDEKSWLAYVLYLIIYIASGADVIKNAFKKIIKGRMMDENFLMTIASFGAFLISECSEGVAVMLFYQVGEWFQSYAVGKSRESIKELMNIRLYVKSTTTYLDIRNK